MGNRIVQLIFAVLFGYIGWNIGFAFSSTEPDIMAMALTSFLSIVTGGLVGFALGLTVTKSLQVDKEEMVSTYVLASLSIALHFMQILSWFGLAWYLENKYQITHRIEFENLSSFICGIGIPACLLFALSTCMVYDESEEYNFTKHRFSERLEKAAFGLVFTNPVGFILFLLLGGTYLFWKEWLVPFTKLFSQKKVST